MTRIIAASAKLIATYLFCGLLAFIWQVGVGKTDSVNISKLKQVKCGSATALYSLSRTVVEVTVHSSSAEDGFTLSIKPKHLADPEHTYCLDVFKSTLSEVSIEVKMNNNLLTEITTRSTGDPSDLSGSLIKENFVAISSSSKGNSVDMRSKNMKFGSNKTPVFVASYDPFNAIQTTLINNFLTKMDFCLILDGKTFNKYQASIQEYCDEPRRFQRVEKQTNLKGIIQEKRIHFNSFDGILYRPRLLYRYFVAMRKDGNWILSKIWSINLENAAPILAFGIGRSLFAGREATVTFDHGELHDVNIRNDNELLGFVNIPLRVVRGIIELPSMVVNIRIGSKSNSQNLVAAQQQLLDLQENFIKQIQNTDMEFRSSPPIVRK